MTDDPWASLTVPSQAATANMRPVGPIVRWHFYWMLDSEGRRILGLRHAAGLTRGAQLPRPEGIGVDVRDFPNGEEVLAFKLLDPIHREIFARLCHDIVSSTSSARTESEAVVAAVSRTWRWHHLLRGGRDARLTADAQKGLLGELSVLDRHILPAMPCASAVEAWTGPAGAPKDFEVGHIAIEVKAQRGGATPFVQVNSEHQLDQADFAHLFLKVVKLARPGPADPGFSVSDVVNRIRQRIGSVDPRSVDALNSRLAAVGYRDEDDYSDSLWIETGQVLFEVAEDFPRVSAGGLLPGVAHVRYAVALATCDDFIVCDGALQAAIEGTLSDS